VSRETNDGADPNAFIPKRFLDGKIADPYSYAFGFGRRLCPGKAFAEESLFILISSILATFQISPALDETRQEIPINPTFASGLVR
jgi:cytochrome P450